MAENISKIILNGTEYVIKDAATQYHTINGQSITGGTGDIVITGGLKKWEGTRSQYNALSSYDADTLYVITDEDVEIPVVPTKVSAFENDAGYLTHHQDISGLATKTELNNKQDKGDYALKTDIPTVPTKVSAFQNDKGYLTEHQDLSSYALKTELPVIPTKVSAFENDAGYLTQHQDISNLATKTELNNKQDTLVSGTNVKTINGQSLLGSGDIATVPVTTDNVNYTNSSSTKTLTQVLNNTEEITFTLEDGSTVTKKFILG